MATYKNMRVELDHTSRFCRLQTNEEGLLGTYPYVWLRDNCRCTKCLHPTGERLTHLVELDPDIVPEKAEIIDDQAVKITWPDGHLSLFPIPWLEENQFSKMVDPISTPIRKLWGKEFQDKIPKFSYTDIKNNDKFLYDWLEVLQVYGMALIQGAPLEEAVVGRIGRRISHLKQTHYG